MGQADVRLALHGVQQVGNALAAALAANQGSPWRMEVHQVPGGPVLVVDCFNAIPASAEHRRIARVAEELGVMVVGYERGSRARCT